MRVFCGSMCDVFEASAQIDRYHRLRLWDTIERTPHLTWQLLTKRPENIAGLWPWRDSPPNVWLGVTAENQARADERIPILARIEVPVRFVSCEPLLGAIDLRQHLRHLGWVIAGRETGPGARPMGETWPLSIAHQCGQVGVPFFWKGAPYDAALVQEFPRCQEPAS